MSVLNKCCDGILESVDSENSELVNLEGLICYCFHHSKQELYEAVCSGCEQAIIDDVKAKMKDPGCFCETANPSGKCCLADMTAFIKAVKIVQKK